MQSRNGVKRSQLETLMELYPLFVLQEDEDGYEVYMDDFPCAHPLWFENMIGGIRVRSTGVELLFNLWLDPIYSDNKFFTEMDNIPEEFYYKLLDCNIKIYNKSMDLAALERKWKISRIIQ